MSGTDSLWRLTSDNAKGILTLSCKILHSLYNSPAQGTASIHSLIGD